MPAGVPSIKQLDKLVSAALLQALQGGGAPSAAPAGKYSFLSDPKFLSALGSQYNAPIALGNNPMGRQANTALPASTTGLQRSASAMGFQQHHTSILGHIFSALEKPYHAVTGAIEKQSQWADKPHKGESAWDRIVHNAEAIGSGARQGWDGKLKKDYSDLRDEFDKKSNGVPNWLNVSKNDPITNSRVGKIAASFAGDVAIDPLTYTGFGTATKVKDLGRSAANLQKVLEARRTLESAGHEAANVPKVFLGGDLKENIWLPKGKLPNSAAKANAMKRAVEVSKLYGQLSWSKLFEANRAIAEKELAKQGTRRYDSLEQMRKMLKGNATAKEWADWNRHVGGLIERRAGELSGDVKSHMASKAGELLDIATHSNLARTDVGKQLQKTLAIRVGGKVVAHGPALPESAINAVKAAAMSDKVKGIRDPIMAAHDLTTRIFRTGSHIDPLINAMRAAKHSSVIETINNHVRDTRSIWNNVSNEVRESIAQAASRGLTNVKVAGGKSLATGQPVNDLVGHVTEQLNHLQNLIGKHEGALATFEQFNKQLPQEYRISKSMIKGGNKNWLRDAWQEQYLAKNAPYGLQRIGKDPATFIHFMHKALYSAAAENEYRHQVIGRFGHQIRGASEHGNNVKDVATKVLVDKHGYRHPVYQATVGGKSRIIPGYENHVFHPDVAKGIESVHTMMEQAARSNHMTTREINQAFNTATQIFKTVVTKFNPGFHERNLIGEIANGAADGVINPRWFRQAAQVLRLHGKTALDTGEDMGRAGARVHNALLPDAYEHARIAALKGTDVVTKKRMFTYVNGERKQLPGITADMYWHAYVQNGLKTGWISTEFGKATEGGVLRKIASKPNAAAQHLTENIEDYARLAHFISRVERSHLRNFEQAAEEAAQYVRKYHFDYNDFTNTEKNIFSRIIPFYKWTRKNIPLQMALMFQKPGYFLTQMKALNSISEANGYRGNGNNIPDAGEVMPIWLRDALAVPVGQGSSGTRYLDAPLPTKDAFKFFGEGPRDTFDNLMYMANPIGKVPAEIGTRHQIGGAPIQTDRYVAGLTPYTNFLHNLMNKNNTGKSTNWLQFLTGLGLVEDTPARIKSELKRQQSEQSAARKKYRTNHGALPVGGRPK